MLAHNGLNRKISCWQRWPDELHEGQIWYSEVCSILFIEAEIEAEKKMNQRRERARNHITPNMAVARFELNFPFADHGDNSPGLFSRTYDWAPGPC